MKTLIPVRGEELEIGGCYIHVSPSLMICKMIDAHTVMCNSEVVYDRELVGIYLKQHNPQLSPGWYHCPQEIVDLRWDDGSPRVQFDEREQWTYIPLDSNILRGA